MSATIDADGVSRVPLLATSAAAPPGDVLPLLFEEDGAKTILEDEDGVRGGLSGGLDQGPHGDAHGGRGTGPIGDRAAGPVAGRATAPVTGEMAGPWVGWAAKTR